MGTTMKILLTVAALVAIVISIDRVPGLLSQDEVSQSNCRVTNSCGK